MTEQLTWEQLTLAEPRLRTLLALAKSVKDDQKKPRFCANVVWYRPAGLKDQLCNLVGWGAPASAPDFMRSAEAYDLAYEKVYAVLPPCRNCSCL